jgi:hypothetical protein
MMAADWFRPTNLVFERKEIGNPSYYSVKDSTQLDFEVNMAKPSWDPHAMIIVPQSHIMCTRIVLLFNRLLDLLATVESSSSSIPRLNWSTFEFTPGKKLPNIA